MPVLISFINVGKVIASSAEQFLLLAADLRILILSQFFLRN